MAHVTKQEIEAYCRRIEELEAKESMLSDANSHMAERFREADNSANPVKAGMFPPWLCASGLAWD